LHLFPISWREWSGHIGDFQAEMGLEQRLLYGMYPAVLNAIGQEREILANLSSSYLYKDLLSFGNIRKPDLLEKLLQALAFQIGSEVSINEISNTLQVDKKTVENYIGLLEKAYVIFRLGPYSRNLRNEISTTRKIYFYDNGIRNALIGNFNPMNLRQDTGALWENFLVSERMKMNHYSQQWFAKGYFWRTKQQQEIDYVEENNGQVSAYEFKWNPKAKTRFPRSFLESYNVKESVVIHPGNFQSFLGMP
jgi:predicted AAA+ superfamily ATPase